MRRLKIDRDGRPDKLYNDTDRQCQCRRRLSVSFDKNNSIEGRQDMLLVCYPKCGTCRKAQKWLDEQGIAYDYRDIKTENPSREELELWHAKSGLPMKKFFNTSGMLYKSMALKDKLPAMTDSEMLDLLATDGMLVKRPIAVIGDKVLVGFRQEEWEKAL